MQRTAYVSFPFHLALVSALVTLSVYGLGAYILSGFTPLTTGLYIAFCAWVELSVLRQSCVHCFYYGRVCGLGKGKLASLLFRRGDPRRFIERQVCWKDVIPELLVTLLPVIGGGYLLIEQFSWTSLGAIGALLLLALGGNSLVRRSYACKYCKQKELGCPALAMFSGGSGS